MTDKSQDVLLQEHGPQGVLTLTLHRPQRKNALTRQLVLRLANSLEDLVKDTRTKVVILKGSGDSFCSGADLTTIRDASPEELPDRIDEFHRLIRGIVSAPQPVIAAVDGPAVGFGADLAMACDVRLFSDRAYVEESFSKIGLMPDGGGSYWMPRYCGGRAFEYLAFGTRLTAQECFSYGIASAVVASDDLHETALSWATRLSQSAPLSLMEIKKALRLTEKEALDAALGREKIGQAKLLLSSDFQEGVAAFLEKRTPDFRGL